VKVLWHSLPAAAATLFEHAASVRHCMMFSSHLPLSALVVWCSTNSLSVQHCFAWLTHWLGVHKGASCWSAALGAIIGL
jgi:hypothetical protein